MNFVEVVVNVPIRRTFRRDAAPPPSEVVEDDRAFQTYHYHLPPDLDGTVQPGHLVWVPFGRQEVQGVVLRFVEAAPVPTRPVGRLARPERILNPTQIELAQWIAHTYVALPSETLKLFLPPGLLSKQDGQRRVRAKRELRVRLAVGADRAYELVRQQARSSPQAEVLSWLLDNPQARPTIGELQRRCKLGSQSAIRTLVRHGAVDLTDGAVALALTPAEAQARLASVQGIDRLAAIVDRLVSIGHALWRSELRAEVDVDLALLRRLQAAGIVELTEETRFRDPLSGRQYPRSLAPDLTSEQVVVWRQLEAAFEEIDRGNLPKPLLLHGVTGSGKTEIYLRAIEHVLAQGRQAIVLIPEIALSPQTIARFAGRFPGRVTVIHSQLNVGQRYDVWRALRDGVYDVVVGPRSALFAPLARLGIVVIDEEHEATYKQDAEEWGSYKVFYDARRVARQLAVQTGSLVLMGSATPSLETYYSAEQGEVTLLEMPSRVIGHQPQQSGDAERQRRLVYMELPPIEVVDMRQELRAGNRGIFSRSLASELYRTLDAGEQAILFLNRRGTNTFVICRDCGYVLKCVRCEVPLTFHSDAGQLVCHHCSRRDPVPAVCPGCGSKRIKYFGAGTERIEEAVLEIAPHARVIRWDADTTGRKGSHEAIMEQFSAHEADVLVGTQMIAKGLDLPMVTLVGVVAADVGLFMPDFRSGERTFQLLTQVAGRAGRGERGGRVVIQTYCPEHHVIQAAAQHDYRAFYRREIGFRQEHGYPPVRRMARLVYWDKNLARAERESERLATVLRHRLSALGLEAKAATVIGPAPAYFSRYRGYYRWQILLRASDPAAVLRGMDMPFGWRIDIDPATML